MKKVGLIVLGLITLILVALAQQAPQKVSAVSVSKPGNGDIYTFKLEDINGKQVAMSDFKGKTLLIVNVASKCGYTKQYAPLEAMFEKYKDKGFVILGLPCNQFAGQEPGTNAEIQLFCEQTYGVKFPMFSKIDVNGKDAHPLYVWLKEQTGGGAINWNFNKFLVDKNGSIVKRYNSGDSLEELEKTVISLL